MIMKKSVLIIVVLFTYVYSQLPVIILPGDGGSQIEAKLSKNTGPHFVCEKHTDWFTLWLNLEELAPFVIDCFIQNMQLVYNNKTRSTSNFPGVFTRIPGYGNTSSVEWLDPSRISPGSYFNNIVDMLVSINYTRNLDIRGAPYDFRKAPNEAGEYFRNLKTLIETTSFINKDKKVILLAHSMGSLYSLYFLNRQSQAWKNKYIAGMITLSGPWAGTVKAVKVYAAGDDLGAFVLNSIKLKDIQMTNPSLAFLLPSNRFWSNKEIIVQTPKRNYTIYDIKAFFRDIEIPDGYSMWEDTHKLIYDLKHPGVKTYCLHGVGVKSISAIKYDKQKYFPTKPTIVYGDGDGTVNLRSLESCAQWNFQNGPTVVHKTFKGVNHMQILSDKNAIKTIKDIIMYISRQNL